MASNPKQLTPVMTRCPLTNAIFELLQRLNEPAMLENRVIPWSCPVPVFGDIERATIATLGLNPSNREFLDLDGKELEGGQRRLPTLKSLGLESWSDVGPLHLSAIAEAGRLYFERNPYNGWFKDLDRIIEATGTSYYSASNHACHLDLVPYATGCKWTDLKPAQRRELLWSSGDTLGRILRESQVHFVVVNGASVLTQLEVVSGSTFGRRVMPKWCLPRRSGPAVCGYAFDGYITKLGSVELGKRIRIIGFNHNIQSSFGVTSAVKDAIRGWVSDLTKGAPRCTTRRPNSPSVFQPV